MLPFVRTLATLSVAEELQEGSLTADQLAERVSSEPDMTFRVLRAAVALGLLTYHDADRTFAGTPRLETLCGDSAFTLKNYALTAGGPSFWLPAQYLPQTVRRGENYVEEVLGGDVWEFFTRHDDDARIFRSAMTDLSTPVIREAVTAIDASDAHSVVDVGGADGAFAAELLQRYPNLEGTVLDLPQAMAGVAELSQSRGLSGRLTGTPGDFFDSVPAADLYLLKFILHDWDDESCVKILSNIRRSMKSGSRLLIVEMTVDDSTTSLAAALMDMVMIFALTGRERNISEFEALLRAAGLMITQKVSLHPPYQLIEVQEARP
jgi:ubiquinone/menaquinone biosynthesis C-methylase UbiE